MNTHTRFFALLRSGLWDTPIDTQLFSDKQTDWEAILRIASEQAVIGVTFDGLEKLSADLHPPRPLFMKWVSMVLQIEKANSLLNRQLREIIHLYNTKGVNNPLLLKGQGIARLYIHPEHRQCGDIDLFIPDQYKKAKELILSLNLKTFPESDKHLGFEWNGIEVENHRKIARFYSPFNNKKLTSFIKSWQDSFTQNHYLQDDTIVNIPPPGFNAVYLLIHAFVHLVQEGIGLRQICDWTKVLAVHADEIDPRRFVKELHLLKMEKIACAVGYIGVNYLGLPADCFPLPLDDDATKRNGEYLLNDILKGGNFGVHHQEVKNRPKVQNWDRKIYSYKIILNRSKQIARFSSSEAFWYPLWRIKHFADKISQGRLWQ